MQPVGTDYWSPFAESAFPLTPFYTEMAEIYGWTTKDAPLEQRDAAARRVAACLLYDAAQVFVNVGDVKKPHKMALDYIPGSPLHGAYAGPRNKARVMCIGKHPGAEDLATKRNLCGPTGDLLREIADQIQLDIIDWYYTNIVRWPIPKGMNVKGWHIKDCMPLLAQEIALLQPEYILVMGADAVKAVFNKSSTLQKVRSLTFLMPDVSSLNSEMTNVETALEQVDELTYKAAIKVFSTIHPSAVLREEGWREGLVSDLVKFRDMLRFDSASANTLVVTDRDYRVLQTSDEVLGVYHEILNGGFRLLSIDCEWGGGSYMKGVLRTIQLTWKHKQAVCIVLTNEGGVPAVDIAERVKIMATIRAIVTIEGMAITGHHLRADAKWLEAESIPVMERMAFDCYLDDTEFLTSEGWRKYDDITYQELATVNPKTLQLETQKPTFRGAKTTEGELLHFKGHKLDVVVTPRHRMFVSKAKHQTLNGSTGHVRPFNEVTAAFEFISAKNLPTNSHFLESVRAEVGYDSAPIPTGWTLEDFLVLCGCFVSEGHIQRNRRGNSYELRITQKEGGRVESLMRELESTYREVGCYKNFRADKGYNVLTWHVRSTYSIGQCIIDRMVRDFGEGSENKRLPRWAMVLPAGSKRTLFNAMWSGDGNLVKARPGVEVYNTNSKQLADDVCELMIRAGCGASVGRNSAGMYLVEVIQTAGLITRIVGKTRGAVRKYTAGSHRVVCFSVPNETLVTRRNGKVSFHGNTMLADHALNENAEHGLDSLSVRDTDMGRYDFPLTAVLKKLKITGKVVKREGYLNVPTGDLTFYGMCDTDCTFRCTDIKLKKLMDPLNAAPANCFFNVSLPVMRPIHEIETVGMPVDRERMEQMVLEFEEKKNQLVDTLRTEIARPLFNPRSTEQVKMLLFGDKEDGGYELVPYKTTEKPSRMWEDILRLPEHKRMNVNPSTDAESLEALAASGIKAVKMLRDFKLIDQVAKSFLRLPEEDAFGRSEYTSGLVGAIDTDGRIRTSISQTSETGRHKSSDPNLQNLPSKQNKLLKAIIGEAAYNTIRSCFIAPPERVKTFNILKGVMEDIGYVIIDADFKSAELLVLGYLAGCENLVLDVPGDLHARGAVTSLGAEPWEGFDQRIPPPKWWLTKYKHLRIGRKTVNFGIPYQRGAAAIARQVLKDTEGKIQCDKQQAQAMIDGFYNDYPEIRAFVDNCKRSVLDPGYLDNPYGRRRRATPFHGDESALAAQQREFVNFPIQGTVADAENTALINLYNWRNQNPGLADYKIALAVHDANMLLVRADCVGMVVERVLPESMNTNCVIPSWSFFPGVPPTKPFTLDIDIGVSLRWGEEPTMKELLAVGVEEKWANEFAKRDDKGNIVV